MKFKEELLENVSKEGKYTFPLKIKRFDLIAVGFLNFLLAMILVIVYAFNGNLVLLYISIPLFCLAFLGSLIPFYGSIAGSKLEVDKDGLLIRRFFGNTKEFLWRNVEKAEVRRFYSAKPFIATIDSVPQMRNTVVTKYLVYFKLESGDTIKINPSKFSWNDFTWKKLEEFYPRKLLKALFLKEYYIKISEE